MPMFGSLCLDFKIVFGFANTLCPEEKRSLYNSRQACVTVMQSAAALLGAKV